MNLSKKSLLQAQQSLLRPWRSSSQSRVPVRSQRVSFEFRAVLGPRHSAWLLFPCSDGRVHHSTKSCKSVLPQLNSSIVQLEIPRKGLAMMHFKGGARLWARQVGRRVCVPAQTWWPPSTMSRSFRGRNDLQTLPSRSFHRDLACLFSSSLREAKEHRSWSQSLESVSPQTRLRLYHPWPRKIRQVTKCLWDCPPRCKMGAIIIRTAL